MKINQLLCSQNGHLKIPIFMLLMIPFSLNAQKNIKSFGEKQDNVFGIEYNEKGDKVALASNDNVLIYDADHLTKLKEVNNFYPEKIVCFNYYGPYVALGDQGSNVVLWEVETGNKILGNHGYDGIISSVKISADSLYLVAATTEGIVKVWDIASTQLIHRFQAHVKEVTSLSFSKVNISWLASSGSDGKIKLWDISSGKVLAELKGHKNSVRSIMFHPSKKEIVSSGEDQNIFIWNFDNLNDIRNIKVELNSSQQIQSLSYSSSGKTLAFGDQQGTLWVWAPYGYYRQKLNKSIVGVSYRPSSGQTDEIGVATYGKGARLVDLKNAVFLGQ